MGMHWMYDTAKRGPKPSPTMPRNWWASWVDPETKATDRHQYASEADAMKWKSELADMGIDVTIEYRESNP